MQWGKFLSVMGLLIMVAAWGTDNPMVPIGMQASTGVESQYQGIFSNAEVTLTLHAHGTRYTGEVEYQGQFYPLEANIEQDALRGQFYFEGNSYPFSVNRQGDNVRYETGGRAFMLQVRTQVQFSMPFPVPGGAFPGNGFSPTSFMPSSVSSDNIALALKNLSQELGQDVQAFLSVTNQWLDHKLPENQAIQVLEQQLLPQSFALSNKITQLARLANQGRSSLQLNAKEKLVLRRVEALARKGAKFFNDWYTLLGQLSRLYRSGNREQLQTIARHYLPSAIQGSTDFARQYIQHTALLNKINLIKSAQDGPSLTMNPASLLKWQTLNNMSETMRQGLDLFQGFQHELLE